SAAPEFPFSIVIAEIEIRGALAAEIALHEIDAPIAELAQNRCRAHVVGIPVHEIQEVVLELPRRHGVAALVRAPHGLPQQRSLIEGIETVIRAHRLPSAVVYGGREVVVAALFIEE